MAKISFFKKVNRKASETTSTTSQLILPQQYPKCDGKQFGN